MPSSFSEIQVQIAVIDKYFHWDFFKEEVKCLSICQTFVTLKCHVNIDECVVS